LPRRWRAGRPKPGGEVPGAAGFPLAADARQPPDGPAPGYADRVGQGPPGQSQQDRAQLFDPEIAIASNPGRGLSRGPGRFGTSGRKRVRPLAFRGSDPISPLANHSEWNPGLLPLPVEGSLCRLGLFPNDRLVLPGGALDMTDENLMRTEKVVIFLLAMRTWAHYHYPLHFHKTSPGVFTTPRPSLYPVPKNEPAGVIHPPQQVRYNFAGGAFVSAYRRK